MMEQMDLFTHVSTEAEVFDILYPALQDILVKSNAGQDNISIERGKSYSSVSYLKYDPYEPKKAAAKQLVFRICLRAGQHYFGISNKNLDAIPPEILPHITTEKQSEGFTNFAFDETPDGIALFADFLASILDDITYALPKEFDCCSRFEQCSSVRRCIHPNPAMATSCGYRKILREGKVFYEKKEN